MNAIEVNETSVKIVWDHSATSFKDCDITFNLTWTPSHQLQSDPKVGNESVETNATVHCITSLESNLIQSMLPLSQHCVRSTHRLQWSAKQWLLLLGLHQVRAHKYVQVS